MKQGNKQKIYHSWMHPDLVVKKIDEKSKGVFTNKKITKDTIIVIFGGYVFTFAEESTFAPPMNDFAHQISSEFVIGVRKKAEIQPVDYINHSCEPNSGFGGQIFLIAMRDIDAGEQITFDYCMVLSKAKNVNEDYRFKCNCGTKTCRNFVTWDDWKNPELQKKYKGFFQWYLEKKIEEISD